MPTAPVGELISHSVPYMQHKQIRSNNNFRSYVESIIISDHVLRTGKKQFTTAAIFNLQVQNFSL